MLLIINKADFRATGTVKTFLLSTSLYVTIAGFLGFIEYGLIQPFGIKREKAHYRALRIFYEITLGKGEKILSISTNRLNDLFERLVKIPKQASRDGIKYIILTVLASLLTEWLASGQTINLPIISFGGLVSLLLFIFFGQFFVELAVFPAIAIYRKELLKREAIKEPKIKLGSLRNKFILFFSVSILVVLIILFFILPPNPNVIIFTFFGLVMSVMISMILYIQITETYSAIEEFSKELPKEKRTLFATGSSDAEIVNLYNSLNATAKEVYDAREKLKERIETLEKFYKLTVGRELIMVEYKKKIIKLKEELLEKSKRIEDLERKISEKIQTK